MKSLLFYIVAVIAVIGVLLGIYFLIPGVYHPLFVEPRNFNFSLVNASRFPKMVAKAHHTYALLYFIFGVICAIIAFMLRPRRAVARVSRA
jgi:hypothetical protein